MNPLERPDDFTPKELMTGAAINVGLYNQWLYRNIFSATNEADGPGTISSYSFSDILTVALIVKLRQADIRLKKASRLAHEVVSMISATGNVEGNDKAYIAFGDDGVQVDLEDKNKEMVLRLDIFTVVQNICGRIE